MQLNDILKNIIFIVILVEKIRIIFPHKPQLYLKYFFQQFFKLDSNCWFKTFNNNIKLDFNTLKITDALLLKTY